VDALLVADLTNDGKIDIVAGRMNRGIELLTGNGDATFQPARSIPSPAHPTALAVSDLNGDGLSDLAVTDPHLPTRVGVMLADGMGGFAQVEYASGTHPEDVVVADFNQDGHGDIATANRDSRDVTILLGGTPRPAVAALAAIPARIRAGGRARLRFVLPTPASVRVTVLRGRKVVSRFAAPGAAGLNQIAFARSRTLPPAAYVVRLQAVNRFGRSRIVTTSLTIR
jgi:hypothetical protein